MTSTVVTTRISAFIFDMDGLLVDSEPLGHSTMATLLRRYDCEWRPDSGGEMAGRRLPDAMEAIAATCGLTASVDELCTAFETQFITAVQGQVTPLPGAQVVLALGRAAGLKVALATSGWRRYVDAILAEVGLAGAFDAEVTGGEVTRGKPHPEPFLLAAHRLGMAPEHCVVFEDAPAGVAAATAAGMRAVAIPRGATRDARFPVPPHMRFDSLLEALAWLEAQGLRGAQP